MAEAVHGPTSNWAATPPVRTARPVSWGAIFAGAVLVTVIQLMLGLLGLAIGLAAVEPGKGEGYFAGLGIAGYIWWLASGIVALFIGGWASARLAGAHRRTNGALHGLVVWGLATLFMAYLLTTTAGNIMGGAFNLLDQTVSYGARAVTGTGAEATADSKTADSKTADGKAADGGTANGGKTPEQVYSQSQTTLQRWQATEGAWDQLKPALGNYFDADGATAQDKERVIEILVSQTSMSRPEAERNAEQWAQGAQGLQAAAERAGEVAEEWGGKVADWSAAASFWAFIMLLIGAGAAAFGGSLGIYRTDRFGHDEPVTPPRA
ncbi:MAG TPA: hypothetical protein PK920_01565 [Phycisphaerae bacterium]|jgi:hypothetical protein|nr:hypothetical protein [Phycisphaerae bacterium]HPC21147.1 hypothetical protein [Phycisphaerae bacterium]HRS26745.1 hypothetical protein [Phycisphaerae bacterium]